VRASGPIDQKYTSTRSSSAAVAAEDNPTQLPRGDDDNIDDRINNQQTTLFAGARGGLRGDDTTRDEDMRTLQSNRSRGGRGSRQRQQRR